MGVLSRGYKSKEENSEKSSNRSIFFRKALPTKIVSDGKDVLLESEEAGDEPYMLAHNLPGVVVLTNKDRVAAGKFATSKFGCEVLILDDGFQYFRIKADMNILLVDQINPWESYIIAKRNIKRTHISSLQSFLHHGD